MRYILICFTLFCLHSYSQTTVSGTVFDNTTNDPLFGATIIFQGKGIVTDFDGYFSFETDAQSIELTVSYVGYEKFTKKLSLNGKPIQLDIRLNTIVLNEVQVVADVAIDRKTPVAFSTVPLKKIDEELASQDIPMVLNSTPGVYATQQGGGDGDARITIRGFNQRNVAVMIDGIPVNDMENGWVYWSNWFGLDAVTSNIQVQRGLGASKIAIPSVGGTMNLLTKGIDSRKGGSIKQEVDSYGKLRTTLGYNSGKLNNGWGFTMAASYKRGNGFVDETFSEGWFYYAKIQKTLGKHTLSLSVLGAPQQHGQRSYKSDIATYSREYATDLGINDSLFGDINDKGIGYNKHWGYLNRWDVNSYGELYPNSTSEKVNTKKNYYHKPQFSLRDFWAVSDNFYVSNITYASIGRGGGTNISSNYDNFDENGQYNFQQVYDLNKNNIDPLYSENQSKSDNFLLSSINNHYWYGALSTLNYQMNEEFTFSGGLDLRYYKGEHYREVYDLLGGDYVIDENNKRQHTQIKLVGDKIGYHNDGIVKWSGIFSQVEYSDGKLSAFLNISASNSAYKRIDHFKKKDLVLDDTTYVEVLGTSVVTEVVYDENGSIIGAIKSMAEDTIFHNGIAYTMNSAEAKQAETSWKWIRGFTIKTGANYNIDLNNNIFFNIGYISKAPRFNNIYDYSNNLYRDIENEIVKAVEGGYSFRSQSFSANANAYFTQWENKPSNGGVSILVDDEPVRANINGMDALHKGIEMDLAYRLNSKFTIEGLMSLGDWTWQSKDSVRFYDDNNNPILDDVTGDEIIESFDAVGVHVGDAAQTQFGLSLRYEPLENIYLKIRGTHFDDYYSDFDPLSLDGENAGRESWKIPAYQLVDFHAGYTLKLDKKTKIDFRLSVLNALNEVYISDAQNNDPYNANYTDFDAKSAGVFFGMGRRINLSAKLTF
ncbi:MAG: TonB-dependent receptor [Bacteroidota bacterium]|nr:TonB-dependent receptor [Bacteroidota bacterium]